VILGKHDLVRYGIIPIPVRNDINTAFARLLSTSDKLVRRETYRKDITNPEDYVIVLYNSNTPIEWCDVDVDRYVSVRKCNVKVLIYRELDNVIYLNII